MHSDWNEKRKLTDENIGNATLSSLLAKVFLDIASVITFIESNNGVMSAITSQIY